MARLIPILCAAACLWLPLQAVAQDAPADRPKSVEERLTRTAALVERVRARKAELRKAQPDLYALAMLQVEKTRLLVSDPWLRAYRGAAIRGTLDEADRLLQALADGTEPALATHGRLERAYLAPNDDSPQPYILYVPEAYDGTAPFGLLVYLHGYAPDLGKEGESTSLSSPPPGSPPCGGRSSP